jgi:hypothetical protein
LTPVAAQRNLVSESPLQDPSSLYQPLPVKKDKQICIFPAYFHPTCCIFPSVPILVMYPSLLSGKTEAWFCLARMASSTLERLFISHLASSASSSIPRLMLRLLFVIQTMFSHFGHCNSLNCYSLFSISTIIHYLVSQLLFTI